MAELNQNIDFEIIWKKIQNLQITDDEEHCLNEWLEAHSSHRKYYNNTINFYAKGTQFKGSNDELKKALRKIHRKAGITGSNRHIYLIAVASVAASLLLLVYLQFSSTNNPAPLIVQQQAQTIVPGSNKAILILADGTEHDLTSGNNSFVDTDGNEVKNTGNQLEYISKNSQTAEIKYNTLKIPRGGEYFLILSDSTKVWLNSETTLRFPVKFATDVRNVELTGEAYFEVTKNKDVPFIVTSGNQSVKVLGTQFNISSYADNTQIITTLVEGKVEMSVKGSPQSKLLLNPNEQCRIGPDEILFQKSIVDVSQFTAWKNGRFVFRDQMLEDIMKTLSKWYNIEVAFNREELKQVRFTGNLERYEDFGAILKKIEKTNEVKFGVNNNLITIK